MSKLKGYLLMTVFVLLLAACSANEGGSEGAASEGSDSEVEEQVELRILNFRVEDKAYFDEVNAAFEEEHPNITLKYDAVPTADFPQLKTARMTTGDVDLIASSNESEILNPEVRDQLADLSGNEFLDRFNGDALEAGQFDGKQFFIPISATSNVTFYNKKIFAEHGLNVPETWDEFLELNEALVEKGVDPIMFGGKDQWPVNMIIAQLEASLIRPSGENADYYEKMETEEVKYTDDQWVELFTKLKTLSQYFQKNYTGLDYGQAPGLFAQGRAAMMIDGSWSLAQIEDANPDFETGAFLLPGSNDPTDNQTATTKYGFGWMVNKNSPNIEAAIKYLDFLTMKENYQKYNDMVRMLPTIEGVSSDSPIIKEVTATLENQMPNFESLLTPGADYKFQQFAMQMFLDELTPEEVTERVQETYIDSKPEWK
ncbi:ABC transporter substrate-binding protein [Litoribacterium kuwaitense]|uniref:ABC transporter substrate-binding protein n=1 Tax=Litoribacterium kuwaitense TaxID=1398745 RepID=UPI0013EC0821|nr:extracellular solute-binding protein [Litoribacterium kuwaitense]